VAAQQQPPLAPPSLGATLTLPASPGFQPARTRSTQCCAPPLPLRSADLVKEAVLEKCGFQPRADNTQVYSVKDSPLCLTGTAEVPLGGLYMDQVLAEKQLPIKMAAFGHCFRTEAGAAGAAGGWGASALGRRQGGQAGCGRSAEIAPVGGMWQLGGSWAAAGRQLGLLRQWLMHVPQAGGGPDAHWPAAAPPPPRLRRAGKGLYRVHQFSKVEMFVLSTPEQSEALHKELIGIEQEMFTQLGLHFKVRRRAGAGVQQRGRLHPTA